MAEVQKKDVLELFDERLHDKSRYFYPTTTQASTESAIFERFTKLRGEHGTITLVDGAFDVPHSSHEWYLRHCKIIGAFALLVATHEDDVSMEDFYLHTLLHPQLLTDTKLAVTVDADEKIAYKKSGLKEKGGVQRPIYPWVGRADRLAGYSFSLHDTVRHTVDLVTVEGDSIHEGTPLESSLALAAFLKSEGILDTFIIYGEHAATLDEATNLGLRPVVIDEGPYELNPQTGEAWSSSSIIKRAQGGSVPIPITRPEGL